MGKGKKRAKTRGPEREQQRFLAVHKDVDAALRQWLTEKAHKSQVPKLIALMSALLTGDRKLVDALMARNCAQKLHGADNVWELGPKQNRGGAPRVFLMQKGPGAWFLAAGLEKGSHGVPQIKLASDRERELSGVDPPAGAHTNALWHDAYYVFTESGQIPWGREP